MDTRAPRFLPALLLAAGLFTLSGRALAETMVNPDVEYSVTYEASANEARTLEAVRVIKIVQLGSRSFLVLDLGGSPTAKQYGYIDLDSVRSILPTLK